MSFKGKGEERKAGPKKHSLGNLFKKENMTVKGGNFKDGGKQES
jgi:hypothetical protein